VSRLRKRLQSVGLADELIVTEPAGYRAAVDRADLDLLEFRRLVGDARAAASDGRPDAAAASYRAALALWRGPAFAGIDSDPLVRAAAALDEERAQALEERLDVELTGGGGGELVAELTNLVQQHPHREGLHRALMLALYRAGRQADALAAYRHARQLFHDGLGIEPGAELQRLHHAILNRDPTLAGQPQPHPAPPPAKPRELPLDVAGFTGRADALKELDELLPEQSSPSGPVVITAIAGTAGVGKTALAVHWAHRVVERFPDGQLYVNLRGYATGAPLRPIEALSMLLRSMGMPPDQIPVVETEASARYRSLLADRRVLVVLDNARSAHQVRPLLPGSPGCLALVTSRDRLAGLVARDGAQRIVLDVLAASEAQALLTRLLGRERVETEPEAVDDLARACAYLPLALRIAAAILDEPPYHRVVDLAAGLTAGHRLTTLNMVGDEEQAVQAAFDLSYQALAEPARRLFRLLGLVPGADFTCGAAAALAGMGTIEAQRLLAGLAAVHLVDEQIPGRYTFHDLLREYAKDRATIEDDNDERSAALRRLVDWYLHSAHAAGRLVHPTVARLPLEASEDGPTPVYLSSRGEALAWLDAERPNLVAIAAFAADRGPRRAAWLLADALRVYVWHGMHSADGLVIGHAGTVAAEADGDLRGQAAAQLSLSMAHLRRGETEQAVEYSSRAAALAEASGWFEGHASALHWLALVCWQSARLRDAIGYNTKALAINHQLGRRAAQAAHLNNLGGVHLELGELQTAVDYLSEALSASREGGSRNVEAAALACLGEARHQLGQLDEALANLAEAAEIAREIGERGGEAVIIFSQAAVHNETGNRPDALKLARAGIETTHDGGDRRHLADGLNTLGAIYASMGDHDAAQAHFERALAIAHQSFAFPETGALIGIAAAHLSHGSESQAAGYARRALDLAQKVGYQTLAGQALTLLAQIQLRLGNPVRARELANRALGNHRRTGRRLGEAQTLAVLGNVAMAVGDTSSARRDFLAARELFEDIGAPVPPDVVEALRRA
jgi:tetratricopeptide (TPR) repeat protein